MADLETIVDELNGLNGLRERSEDLCRHATRSLLDWPEDGVNVMEDAVVIKALCRSDAEPPAPLLRRLEKLTLAQLRRHPMFVDFAAKVMQALVAAPVSAFSQPVMLCYYTIVREVYTADQPDWSIGGIRAGETKGDAVTAYVASECVRAVEGLARAMERTGDFLAEFGLLQRREQVLSRNDVPQAWRDAEAERLQLAFFNSMKSLSGNLALRLPPPRAPKDLDSYLEDMPKRIRAEINNANTTFADAAKAIRKYRAQEKNKAEAKRSKRRDPEAGRRFRRSVGGHEIALKAVSKAAEYAKRALELLSRPGPDVWPLLREQFRNAAAEVRKLLRPTRMFLSSVLDHELSLAHAERPWDREELVFAAAAFGAIEGNWEDERLQRSVAYLSRTISEAGRFPPGRPIRSEDGAEFQVDGSEPLCALAKLLQNVPSPLDPHVVQRVLAYFERAWVPSPAAGRMGGFGIGGGVVASISDRGATATSAIALSRVCQMLDARINALVYSCFSVKRPRDLSVDLDSLFYGDYGLRMVAPRKISRPESLAISLERMRAHVRGVTSNGGQKSPLYSMVLHGPPGTGKTTLVEAIAASARVPLVEVTPSDIVVGGVDAVERRTRAVFRALSLLRRTVILFDEFDPVLWKRGEPGSSPATVFAFLTPGMLPKLKDLNRSARKNHLAYVLVTNLIGHLDPAAVRSGRFDAQVAVLPPDLLSRAGRLVSEWLEYERESGSRVTARVWRSRLGPLLMHSAGCSMEALGKPNWFTRPQAGKDPQLDTPFGYLRHGGSQPQFASPEARFAAKVTGTGPAAEREVEQWRWVAEWDEQLTGHPSGLPRVLETPPDGKARAASRHRLSQPSPSRRRSRKRTAPSSRTRRSG